MTCLKRAGVQFVSELLLCLFLLLLLLLLSPLLEAFWRQVKILMNFDCHLRPVATGHRLARRRPHSSGSDLSARRAETLAIFFADSLHIRAVCLLITLE